MSYISSMMHLSVMLQFGELVSHNLPWLHTQVQSALLDHMTPEQTSAVDLMPGTGSQWLRGVACCLQSGVAK